MNQVPGINTNSTTAPTPQPGPGRVVRLLASPSPETNAALPMPVVYAIGASAVSTGEPATMQGNAAHHPASATASKPFYRHVPPGLSLLGQAAYSGDLEQVHALIRQGCDVNVRETRAGDSDTPLVAAAGNGHAGIVKALLKAGADVNLKNSDFSDTALIRAAERGDREVVTLLLQQAGIRIDETGRRGQTAFYCAVVNGHAAIADILFDKSVVTSKVRNQLMLAACRDGRLAIVELLHRRSGIGLAYLDTDYCLHLAAYKGHAEVVAYLLKAGMDANRVDSRGVTPLQNACRSGNVLVVAMLMAHSAVDSSAATSILTPTPLYIAADEGHLALLDYLLQAGVNPNLKDIRSGRTALMAAASKGRVDIMGLLLACPTLKIDLVCHVGCNALQLAMFNNMRDAVACLLKAGAKIALPTVHDYSKSLLRWAIERKDCDMVRLLLARYAAGFGQALLRCDAAMAHAVQVKCADIVECLLDAGLAESAPRPLVSLIDQILTREGHAAASAAVFEAQACRASAMAAGMAAEAPIKDNALVYGLEHYVPAIVIADLQLGCKPAASLWLAAAAAASPALAAPLQTFNALLAPIVARRLSVGSFRESLLRHLHGQGLSMAVALPLADCVSACDQGLALLASAGQTVNAQQKAMYYAAALSALKPQALGTAAARIYASSGVSAKGAERLALAAQGQFNAIHNLAGQASALLGEEMLEQIMPACMKHTDGRYQVDVAGLAAALVASGLMRPFAHVIAERWNVSVKSLMATAVAIPPGATFFQVTQILDDAMHRLGQSHFAASLLAALREASLLTQLRQMTSTAQTDEALPMLFQIQADQLRQYAEQLQQG